MIIIPSGMQILLYSFEIFEVAIEFEVHLELLPHHPSHTPMEPSMSATNLPARTSQFSSSMPSIDDLLRQYEAQSTWKLVCMPNLTALCHEHTCNKCSTYLEHLLIGAHMGKLCAHPDRLERQLDHAWPAAMNDICRNVGEPLAKKLDVMCDLCNIKDDKIDCNRWEINDLCDKLAEEHRLQRRLKERLAQYKGKQKEESEATMGSPLLHKCQVAGAHCHQHCQQYTEIPAEVDIPPPKKSKDGRGAHVLHDPMEDIFHREYTSKLSTNDTPNPLKMRSKKKNCEVVLPTTSSPILQICRMLT